VKQWDAGDDWQYRQALLELTTAARLRRWLAENPAPHYWQGGKYSWAYSEMPLG
jgi:hypothetical protein